MCSVIHLAWEESMKKPSSANVSCHVTVTSFWQKMLVSHQLARRENSFLNQALNYRFSSMLWGAGNHNSFCFYLLRCKAVVLKGASCKEKCHEQDPGDQKVPWSPCWQRERSVLALALATHQMQNIITIIIIISFFFLQSASVWWDGGN